MAPLPAGPPPLVPHCWCCSGLPLFRHCCCRCAAAAAALLLPLRCCCCCAAAAAATATNHCCSLQSVRLNRRYWKMFLKRMTGVALAVKEAGVQPGKHHSCSPLSAHPLLGACPCALDVLDGYAAPCLRSRCPHRASTAARQGPYLQTLGREVHLDISLLDPAMLGTCFPENECCWPPTDSNRRCPTPITGPS